jgi:glycosyltransferase involved in cell wall biosynthesis
LEAPRLTVIVPAFNEEATISDVINRVRKVQISKQIVVVNDGSTDGTACVLEREALHGDIEVITHQKNQGKGAAVRTGLEQVRGKVVIIQDADLEYDPDEYADLLAPIERGITEVVYGSRFLGAPRTAMHFWHALGNRFLTLVANVLYDTTLSDLETGYKVFTAEVARSLRLRSNGWGVDPEITAKILRQGHRIYEVPISYAGREYNEGKKITWRDGITVLFTMLRYRIW